MKEKFINKPVFHILIILVIGFLSYSNTFHSPFQWDDNSYFLKDNHIIKDLGHFIEPSQAKGLELYESLKSRYVGYLTFALNYRMDGLHVTGYHIVNLCIHLLNSLLVYFIVNLTFRTPFLKGSALAPYSLKIAFFSALFFVVHPIQTEAVTYVFQRFASLVTMFYLLSLALYIKGRLLQPETKSKDSLWPVVFYLGSLFSAILAMKTKENAFTLPVMIALYEFLFFSGPLKKRLLRLSPLLLTMAIVPLSIIGTHKSSEIAVAELNPVSLDNKLSNVDYLFTQFRVIVSYLRLLVFPVGQNFARDYPFYHTFFKPEIMASFFFLLVFFGLGVYLIYRSAVPKAAGAKPRAQNMKTKTSDVFNPALPSSSVSHYRLMGFGIVWFFVTLSVESSIIPIPMVFNEYRCYLPSAGLFIAFVTAVFSYMAGYEGSYERRKKIVIPVLSIIIISLSMATFARNMLWRDRVSLWEDTAGKSPQSAQPFFTLGQAYQEGLQFEKALDAFARAIAIKPDYSDAYNDRGQIFYKSHRLDDAVREFQAALKYEPDHEEALTNLGVIYFDQGRMDEAIRSFQAALKLKPDLPEAHNNLGSSYLAKGLVDDAIGEFKTALNLDPNNAAVKMNLEKAYEVKNNDKRITGTQDRVNPNDALAVNHYELGCKYLSGGRTQEAIQEFQAALKLKPDYANTHNNLGIAYQSIDNLNEARKEFQAAIRFDPGLAEAHNNLGGVYYKSGKLKEALKEYQAAIKIRPDYADALNNYKAVSKFAEESRQNGKAPQKKEATAQ